MIYWSHDDFALVNNYTWEYRLCWGGTLVISHTLTLSLATMRLVVCFLSLLTVFGPAECGNVLVWFTEGSHWLNLKIVLETLIDRGHNVTVLVPDASLFMKAKESDRFSYQPFNASVDEQEVRDFIDEFLYFSVYETDQLNFLQIQMKVLEFVSIIQDMCTSYCDGILRSPKLMDKLRNGKFNVVLSDPIYQCSDIVAEELTFPWFTRSDYPLLTLLRECVVSYQLHHHLFLESQVNSRTRWASQSESSICSSTFLKIFLPLLVGKNLTTTTLNI